MSHGTWPGNLFVDGTLTAVNSNLPAGTVRNTQIGGTIESSKLQPRRILTYGEAYDQIATAKRVPLGSVYGATATLINFRAKLTGGSICTSDATVTVDLYKNGSTILSAAISIGASDTTDWKDVTGFTSTSTVADDYYDAVITVSAGSGALGDGLRVELVIDDELPS